VGTGDFFQEQNDLPVKLMVISIYRVIKSSGTIPKEVTGDMIWSRKCK
jgi:hypothetical protein